MKLSKNSISAKIYKWFYQTENLPMTLCPYFWQLVIAWILALPLAIITLPAMIIYRKNGNDQGNGVRIFAGVFIYGTIFLLLCMLISISMFWHIYSQNSLLGIMQSAGLASWVLSTAFGLGFGARVLFYRFKERKREVKTPNIVTEFVKAKYNRYCPKIDWE